MKSIAYFETFQSTLQIATLMKLAKLTGFYDGQMSLFLAAGFFALIVFAGCRESNQHSLSLQVKAIKGDAKAQFEMGMKYLHGDGVATNLVEGFSYIQHAADRGFPEAENFMGKRYMHGWGVKTNCYQGAFWFKKAAQQGSSDAQFRLGLCYNNGQGVPQSFKEAALWMLRAAKQGHKEAQWALATGYENGEAGKIDYREAYKWALIQGYPSIIKRTARKLKLDDRDAVEEQAEMFKPVLEVDPDNAPDRHIPEWSLGAITFFLYAIAAWIWWLRRSTKAGNKATEVAHAE